MPNDIFGFGAFAGDLQDLASNTADARQRVERETDRVLEAFIRDVFADSQRDVPVKSGALKESGRVFRRPDGSWVIEYTEDYSVVVAKGSRPHLIEPRNAESLSWIDEDTGERVFAAVSRHPGTSPQPYLHNNFDRRRTELPDRLFDGLERALQGAYR